MKHILFVDDERRVLDGLRRVLREFRNSWEMAFAESVDEALARTESVEFDAIVSDIDMPSKSGFDLLRCLRSDPATRDIPVIILTGRAEDDSKRRALDLGASDLLCKPVDREELIARLRSALRLKEYQDALKQHSQELESKVRERTSELEVLHRDVIQRLAKAGEYRDEQTGDHVARVANFSRVLAEALHLDIDVVERIFVTSSLHDLGKIGIPDSILRKPDKLTPKEWETMREHCSIGSAILLEEPKGMAELFGFPDIERELRSIRMHDPIREMASTIALSHHERWDGSGYPKGLKGEEIPLPGQIVALADVYDAVRSIRPYKKAFSVEETLDVIRSKSGSHFSPGVLAAFESSREEFEKVRRRLPK